jgi:hypothetical protein
VTEKTNLVYLHSICEAYGTLPSDYLGLESAWARWQVDQITVLVGRDAERKAEGALRHGSGAAGRGKAVGYRSAAGGRAVKRVKINPNGTW